MNKKIKIAISIVFTIILISLASSVFAANYKPTGYYPYYQNGEWFFCGERGAILRFWDDAQVLLSSENFIKLVEDSKTDEGRFNSREEALEYLLSNNHQASDTNYLLGRIKENLVNRLELMEEKYRAYKVGKGWDGNFEDNIDNDTLDLEYFKDANNIREVKYSGKKVAATPIYNREETITNNNNRLSYILSSGIKVPSTTNDNGHKTNYQTTISDANATNKEAIQYALWQDTKQNNPNASYVHNVGATPAPGDSKYDQAGLYAEAVEYENFYNTNIKNGYNATFNNQAYTVQVNRSAQSYTVGPFTITYPDNQKFSYIEDMWISSGSNTTRNFTITGGGTDSNTPYPKSGVPFYITFNANNLGNPSNIQVNVKFNYLNNTYSKYKRMYGTGKIYEFFAWAKAWTTDEVTPKELTEAYRKNKINGTVWFTTQEKEREVLNNGNPITLDNGRIVKGYYEYVRVNPGAPYITGRGYEYYKYEVYYQYNQYAGKYEWYIGIRDANETYNAQVGTHIAVDAGGKIKEIPVNSQNDETGGSREWKTLIISTNYNIDLRMKLQGKVWVDNAAGKETEVDGLYVSDPLNPNEDKLMQNVEVVLYRYGDNAIIDTKTTDKNGHYEFKDLNALSQYYVRFKYNGQYYEPTYYTAPTVTTNWQNTSNGTDYQNNYVVNKNFEGRLNYNNKFASINSSASNYKGENGYNQTFTKKELLGYTLQTDGTYKKTREAVIDEFGNLILQTSNDATTKKMIQYVKDCMIYSWTKNAKDIKDAYPVSNTFTINNSQEVINDKSQHINQGYKVRQEVDIALENDVYNVTLEINGKTQEYKYNTRDKFVCNNCGHSGETKDLKLVDANNGRGKELHCPECNSSKIKTTWDVSVRLSDAYYDTMYSREIYTSDYAFKISSYGNNPAIYGKTIDDELKVYVTYKLTVANQSMSIRTRIDEIVDYYDKDYTYIADRSYIQIVTGNNAGKHEIRTVTESRYKDIPNTTTTINGYNNLYIRGLDNIYLDGGQIAYVYLTFMVNKDNSGYITLDEKAKTGEPIGVGKENIAEINGYSTLYKDGTMIPNVTSKLENGKEVLTKNEVNKPAGLVDVDSNPGNLKASYVPKDGNIKYNKFEDDTDKAPNIKIILDRDNMSRIASGYVWEDNRNLVLVNDTQATAVGNGIREEGETLINGVTVQLVEINKNGTETIWREYEQGTGTANKTSAIINYENIVKDYAFTGDVKGTYAFQSFIPGDYIVRFIYGNSEKTVLTKSSEVTSILGKSGLNDKSYNGHDYKSTTYQANLETYNGKNLTRQYDYDIAKGDTALVSDAKDLYNVRKTVNAYSKNEIRNSFAEELASYMNVPEYNGIKYDKSKMDELLNRFITNTKMTAETGIINIEVQYNTTSTENQTINNKNPYHLANLDLGLEERPKAQLEVVKNVTNLKIVLSNGNILFDSMQGTDNLGWIKNPEYYSYDNNLMTPSRYGSIANIRNNRTFGLVQPTIDKEIMHGAVLQITYEIKIINTGEVDYEEEKFYYTGKAQNVNNPVTTTAIQLVDYVPNNLQYYENNNSTYWKVVKTSDLVEGNDNLVNKKLENNLNKFNTKITTTKTNTALVPVLYTQKVDSSKNSSVTVPLILTQVLSAENKDDDLDYINRVEVVSESNSIGRKMAYSVVGNQDPTKVPQELDASEAEVTILPPFGQTLTYIIISIITLAGATLIVLGIIFIKKKVLTK